MPSSVPKPLATWTNRLFYLPFEWRGMECRVPFFQVYAQLVSPVPDRITHCHDRDIAILQLGRYEVPLVDPFHDSVDCKPAFAIVLSHHKANKFGLFAYPADKLYEPVGIPANDFVSAMRSE